MYLNFRYIKSTNESSSLKTRDLNGSITGKYYLNFGRENKFHHALFRNQILKMKQQYSPQNIYLSFMPSKIQFGIHP